MRLLELWPDPEKEFMDAQTRIRYYQAFTDKVEALSYLRFVTRGYRERGFPVSDVINLLEGGESRGNDMEGGIDGGEQL